MSFHEISIAVRAENRASYAFRTISMDAIHLAYSFGALDSQTGRLLTGIMTAIHLMTSLKGVLSAASVAQTAHNVAVGAGAGVQTTLTGAMIGETAAQTAQNTATNQGILSQFAHKIALVATTAAHYIHAAGAWVATAAQNALNISYATFLALTGVGIAVIIAAAVAMWSFANSMNAATASTQGFNAAASETPEYTRGIRRAGEQEYYRRGVEY